MNTEQGHRQSSHNSRRGYYPSGIWRKRAGYVIDLYTANAWVHRVGMCGTTCSVDLHTRQELMQTIQLFFERNTFEGTILNVAFFDNKRIIIFRQNREDENKWHLLKSFKWDEEDTKLEEFLGSHKLAEGDGEFEDHVVEVVKEDPRQSLRK